MFKMLKFLKENPSVKLLLVEKTDRLYRNIKDWVILDDVMDLYNIEVHFVKENFILSPNSKSMEKFMHGIKVLMAKNYIDNLSDEIKKGMKEKVLQGGYPHKAPVGYFNKKESKEIKEKIESTKKLLQSKFGQIFEIRGIGKSELAKMISTSCIGDFASVYLAILQGIDPTPTEAIELTKKCGGQNRYKEKIIFKLKKMVN